MRLIAALCCLAMLQQALPAMAQTDIHHCIGTNGGAVFTDQPCAALQATPALSSRSTAEGATSPSTTQPPLVLCVSSVSQLRQSVIDAFASRDPNRLAGLMLWDGYGRGAAIADIRSLAAAMKQPLVGVDGPGSADPGKTVTPAAADMRDPFATEPPAAPAPPGDQLVLHTGGVEGDAGAHDLRFDIVHQAGCLWLRNAD